MRIVPDKSWITIPRIERYMDSRYQDGIKAFIEYAKADPRNLNSEVLYCPCSRCKNSGLVKKSDLAAHLRWGFFNLEENPLGWEYLFGKAGKYNHALRVWRYELKLNYHTKIEHDWERFWKRDKRVDEDRFGALLILWDNQDYKDKCKRNSENRNVKEYDHHTGTTSFAQIRDDYCKKENAPYMPVPLMFKRAFGTTKEGYANTDKRKEKVKKVKLLQEALDAAFSETLIARGSQDPHSLSIEENSRVGDLVLGEPKKNRDRWMGVGAQRLPRSFQPMTPNTETPTAPSVVPSYTQQDYSDRAFEIVSRAMSFLEGQVAGNILMDISIECMSAVPSSATRGVVSAQILKCCKDKVDPSLFMSLMRFLASETRITNSGSHGGQNSGQCGDDVVGSSTRRQGDIANDRDEDLDEAEHLT